MKLHTVYAVILEAIKSLQLVVQVAEFKFVFKFEPVPVIWQSLRRLFQKAIESQIQQPTSWGHSPALLAIL